MRTGLIKTKTNPIQAITSSKKESITDGSLDMVIAFDTTGSMASYISDVKDHIKELVPKLLANNPNIRIGIVAFGDYCDMTSREIFGKAYQVLPLTNNQSKIINFVMSARNTSGGDGDEFYELVIKKITEETKWRKDAVKSVLLIADANPHPVGYSCHRDMEKANIDWRIEAEKSAALGIKWDTVGIRQLDWLKELSTITNGVHSPFSKSTNTAHLVEIAAYARGGECTKEAFTTTVASLKSDAEMNAVCAAYMKEMIL